MFPFYMCRTQHHSIISLFFISCAVYICYWRCSYIYCEIFMYNPFHVSVQCVHGENKLLWTRNDLVSSFWIHCSVTIYSLSQRWNNPPKSVKTTVLLIQWKFGIKRSDITIYLIQWKLGVKRSDITIYLIQWKLGVKRSDITIYLIQWKLGVKRSDITVYLIQWKLDIKRSDITKYTKRQKKHHFFRATPTKIHAIKINICTQISCNTPY